MSDSTGPRFGTWPITAIPAIDVELENERLPPYPAGDDARLAVWRAKKITTAAKETREYLARLFGATCHLCEQPIDMSLPLEHPGAPQIDHLEPQSAGGSYAWGNVALSHRTCNSSKNDLRAGIREPAIYRQKLADALFIHERSAAITMLRAHDAQEALDDAKAALRLGDRPTGRARLGMTEFEWEEYRPGVERGIAAAAPAADAAWARYTETRARLDYPKARSRKIDHAIHDERDDLDAVTVRMKEKLAARRAEGDEMVFRLRSTINLLERTQIMLDEDLGIDVD
ncbi:HNH endonuclease [Curtobacterium flaccumfaciens]|uniref:HNH endonuclease n=1 Tax=Curtobacterium flaccumfaciens TaxID=2035 RepID=UPI003EB931BB